MIVSTDISIAVLSVICCLLFISIVSFASTALLSTHTASIVWFSPRCSFSSSLTPSVMVAAKYFDDVYYTNTFYAEVGGISVNEINNLEVDFLCRIGFNLFVSTEEFRQYYKDIADHCSNCFTCCRDCVIIIILTRIDSIRLPELINCGPKGEAPILRYRETPANTNFSFNGMFSSNMGTFSGYGYPSNGGCYSGYSFGSNQGLLASMNYASMASYASDLGNITPTYQMY